MQSLAPEELEARAATFRRRHQGMMLEHAHTHEPNPNPNPNDKV